MDSVLRAVAIYLVLMILFKIAGRRSLAELTTFRSGAIDGDRRGHSAGVAGR